MLNRPSEVQGGAAVLRWIVGIVFIAHGLAHGVGVAGSMFGAELEGGPAAPTFEVGLLEPLFATLFLVGLLAFVAAGGAVIARRPWWRPLTLGAAVISMVPVVVWWEAAFVGAYLNAFAVVVALAATKIPGLADAPGAPSTDRRTPARSTR
jgi:hypothetical protein